MKKSNHTIRCAALTALVGLLAFSATHARAAIYTYAPPALAGTTVTYTSVSETSNTDPGPLYGSPTVSGNNLLFNNLNFNANSINGAPIDFTDGQINASLVSTPGQFLSTLAISEFGDYNVSATPANPAAVNFVKVFPQALQITVTSINGVALAIPLVDNTTAVMTLSPSGGDFQTNVDPSTGSWTGALTANLASIFGSSKITGVSISFNNQLLAQSQTGGIATISKKGFYLIPGTSTPEPTSLGLAAVAAAGLLRRRRAS